MAGGPNTQALRNLERPKGMHHETYWQLCEEYEEAEMAQLAGLREWLDKLEIKVG